MNLLSDFDVALDLDYASDPAADYGYGQCACGTVGDTVNGECQRCTGGSRADFDQIAPAWGVVLDELN